MKGEVTGLGAQLANDKVGPRFKASANQAWFSAVGGWLRELGPAFSLDGALLHSSSRRLWEILRQSNMEDFLFL